MFPEKVHCMSLVIRIEEISEKIYDGLRISQFERYVLLKYVTVHQTLLRW